MTLQDQESPDEAVVDSSTEPDYASISIPSKPPTEFHYTRRRAEILQQVLDVGHPAALNQSELAERYGVSQQQISKDLDRLDEYIREHISRRRDLKIAGVLNRAMSGLLEEGEHYKAAKVAQIYQEYIEERQNTLEFRRELEQLKAAADRHQEAGGSR